MGTSCVFCKGCWFVFVVIFDRSNSLLHIEESSFANKPEIDFAVELFFELHSELRCINYISRGEMAADVGSDMYKTSAIPVVIGHNYTDPPCQEYFVLVDSRHEILASVKCLHFRSHDNVIISMLNDDCPGDKFLDTSIFGAAQVAVICSFTKSTYRLDTAGDLHVVTDHDNLFQRKTASLKNYAGRSITATTFRCPPFSYGTGDGVMNSSSKENGLLDGIEMKIFLEISRRLNFTWRLQEPPETNKWGQKFENGSWSGGILGALVEGRADLGFCLLWLVDSQASDVDLTFPWNAVCNTFLVPRPQRLNKASAVFLPFTLTLWATITAATALTATLQWSLSKLKPAGLSGATAGSLSWVECLLRTVGVLTMANATPSQDRLYDTRHVVNSWALFTLLITTAYSSGLVSHLTVPTYSEPMDSIRALVKADLYWSATYYPAMNNLFDAENPWHSLFIRKFQLYANESSLVRRHKHAVLGYALEGKKPYFLEGAPLFADELTDLRVMRECISRHFVSLGLAKKSPYTTAFNEALVRLIEGGIVQHWKESAVNQHVDPAKLNLFEDELRNNVGPEALKTDNIQGAFLLLGSGMLACTLVFFAELSLKWMQRTHFQI